MADLTQRDILFASLVGSKVMERVPAFNAIQSELAKHVLPPIPFLPIRNKEGIHEVKQEQYNNLWAGGTATPEANQFFPLSFEVEGQKYLLPYEPIINITGKNNIVRRNVAKANMLLGSIKERWSQDDYEIEITGVLMGAIIMGKVEDCYPMADFVRLKDILTRPEALTVYCEPLQLLGINKIVVEDFSFPFTKGGNVQAYTIKAYSDFSYQLLLDIDE